MGILTSLAIERLARSRKYAYGRTIGLEPGKKDFLGDYKRSRL
jgi:hypothetical protein